MAKKVEKEIIDTTMKEVEETPVEETTETVNEETAQEPTTEEAPEEKVGFGKKLLNVVLTPVRFIKKHPIGTAVGVTVIGGVVYVIYKVVTGAAEDEFIAIDANDNMITISDTTPEVEVAE